MVGMLIMILTGVCVSSSGFFPKEEIKVDKEEFIPTLPIYVPILCALVMPVCVVFQQAAQKYVTNYLMVSSDDFTYGYYFI